MALVEGMLSLKKCAAVTKLDGTTDKKNIMYTHHKCGDLDRQVFLTTSSGYVWKM